MSSPVSSSAACDVAGQRCRGVRGVRGGGRRKAGGRVGSADSTHGHMGGRRPRPIAWDASSPSPGCPPCASIRILSVPLRLPKRGARAAPRRTPPRRVPSTHVCAAGSAAAHAAGSSTASSRAASVIERFAAMFESEEATFFALCAAVLVLVRRAAVVSTAADGTAPVRTGPAGSRPGRAALVLARTDCTFTAARRCLLRGDAYCAAMPTKTNVTVKGPGGAAAPALGAGAAWPRSRPRCASRSCSARSEPLTRAEKP